MKYVIVLGLAASIAVSGEAFAVCDAATQLDLSIDNILVDKTVCAEKANGDQWQEYHEPGGDLIDYKKGPNDPVDPTTSVGTWRLSNRAGGICYSYGGGNFNYCYSVHDIGNGNYEFCNNNGLDVTAKLVPGNGGCGFN
ncbi:hypothetical protein [Methylomarinum vadi]|uniref:hypothetical protein n=1 Tax=Methylomarinum vadi TaxID=438855 RepID=UPI00068D6AAA|nr:hypothetical protein [Methylomarinum vadi]